MKLIYPTLKEGQLIGLGNILKVTVPEIVIKNKRLFLAKCVHCGHEHKPVYSKNIDKIGCTYRCQNFEDLSKYSNKSYKVIEQVNKKSRYWVCECSYCGKIFTRRQDHIKRGVGLVKGCGCKSLREDLTGTKFKNYTVLRPDNVDLTKWVCLCSCGKEFSRHATAIRQKVVKGCCQKHESPLQRKEGTLNRNLFYCYKNGAKRRNLRFELSIEDFNSYINKNCYYCGSEPLTIHKSSGCYGELLYNGIDRIDSNLGYTEENCLTACKICNRAKRTLSFTDFCNWLDKVKNYDRK